MGDIEGSKPQKPPPATFEWIGHQRRKTIKKEPIKSTQKNLGARERVHFFVEIAYSGLHPKEWKPQILSPPRIISPMLFT